MPHVKSQDGWLSVTEVLSLSIPKQFLVYWYGKLGTEKCEQIKRESQDLGKEVHSLIESYFKGENLVGTANAERMKANFIQKFVIPYSVKPLQLELTLKNEKLKLQGTFDAIIETNKGLMIADWKTSNSLDAKSVPLQLSMYNFLNGRQHNTGVAVRIDKESEAVQIKIYDNLEQYEKIWKAAVRVARWVKYGMEAERKAFQAGYKKSNTYCDELKERAYSEGFHAAQEKAHKIVVAEQKDWALSAERIRNMEVGK